MSNQDYIENLNSICFGRTLSDLLHWAYEQNYPYHIVRNFIIPNYGINSEYTTTVMASFLTEPRLVGYLPSRCACCGQAFPSKWMPVYDYLPLPNRRIEEQLTFIGGN